MLSKALTVAALAAAATAQQGMNLSAALTSLPQLSNLTTYLQLYPALVSQLSTAQNVTLLAPSNAAFAKLANSSVGAAFSANDTALIEAAFLYHVLNGTYYASAVTKTPQFIPTYLTPVTNATTLEPGAVVECLKVGSDVKIFSGLLSESTVTSANHNFTGGVIHVIDTFLTIPQNISATIVPLNETAAAGALRKANISGGPLPANVTAFIPSNSAFQSVANIIGNLSVQNLTEVLGYHLIPSMVLYSTDMTNTSLTTLTNATVNITVHGDDIFVNSAKVITPNVLCMEGVVHIIDEVLNPANTSVATGTATHPAFVGATSGVLGSLTSGIPAPSTVPAGATGGAASAASASASSAAGSSSSKGVAARPVQTGAMGVAALFAAGGLIAQM